MKIAVVRASELGDRFDAQFHIARTEVRDREAELRKTVSEKEALRRIAGIPVSERAPLLVLCRSGNPRLTQEATDRAAREYPHLALALIERSAADSVAKLRREIAEREAAIRALVSIGTPSDQAARHATAEGRSIDEDSPFRAGYIYPLKDPAAYDDEDFGTGYAYALIPAGDDPGAQCVVHDAWIVNEAGEVHPGYSGCPVPVRRADLDTGRGRPFDGELPTPGEFVGWKR